ncbi:MAG: DNA alkylation repair protein [Bacteroidales bacterium]|nr:DNA alkylation repair protein [Bacteroidales bacterium]
MELNEVMTLLESYGNEQTKRIFKNHGAQEPIFGVKLGDLKILLKKTKKDHELALKLFETGNSDAMYQACLMADEKKVSMVELDAWANTSNWFMISEYGIAGLTAESSHAYVLAMKWIESEKELVASVGWSTLSGIISISGNEIVSEKEIEGLIQRIENTIHSSPNRVRYAMNAFVISVGSYIDNLSAITIEAALRIGKVDVKMGSTSCKVPFAPQYIEKTRSKGDIKFRKTARC